MAQFLSDEPTLDDLLDRAAFVQKIGDTIASCDPPAVFGLHGDWGAGKTSTLHLLHYYLSGECPENPKSPAAVAEEQWKKSNWKKDTHDHVAVIWFEAWRYQHEAAPVVALLHEMRSQLSTSSKLWSKTKKFGEVAIKSALFSLENLTKHIGFQASKIQKAGEQWEKDHLAEALPSHTLRDFLQEELGKLLPKKGGARLVVLLDDLDRCESQAAYRLLEGIKIYLNLPNCVFVLGVNQSAIEASLAEQLAKEKADNVSAAARLRARDYLEKICKNFWYLVPSAKLEALINRWLTSAKPTEGVEDSNLKSVIEELGVTVAKLVAKFSCVPANPRKVKAFVNTLVRFLAKSKWLAVEPVGQREQAVEKRAALILSLAHLYQFHADIYRIVHWQPAFFAEIIKWCQPLPDGYKSHPALVALERTGDLATAAPSAETPQATRYFATGFPDPERGHLLRIQELLLQPWFIVDQTEVRECLL